MSAQAARDLDPAVSVVVASHDRRLRLRWLLNALEEQTLPREHWELVVVHDYDDRDSEEILDRHPLASAGVLRHIRVDPEARGAARQRNLGWRLARAPIIAFTDDDCRPDPEWLEKLASAAERHPGAIVQGRTLPDPLETDNYASPHYRTVQELDPPGPFAQTCNILYPRALLDRTGGFDEAMGTTAGEDLDLQIRARATGADYVGAPDALIYHCIEGYTLVGALRLARKWEGLVYLTKRHPETRRSYPLGIFWRATHLRLVLAALGLGLARRHPVLALLAVPYVDYALRQRGTHLTARTASALELPGRVVVDVAEVAILARGSIRQRTLLL